jgi:hypothetical protein
MPQAWDAPQSRNPLVMTRSNFLLVDCDNCINSPLAEELQDRFHTYWDKSHSGTGLHAYAHTELKHIRGRKQIVIPISDNPKDGKIEIFLHHPAIITNQHVQYKPLANIDHELQIWLDDIGYTYKKYASHTHAGKQPFDLGYTLGLGDSFAGYLTAHENDRGALRVTKRLLLQHIWDAPTYQYEREGWKPFYETKVAKKLHKYPSHISKHLRELKINGWIDIKYGVYQEGRTAMSVRLK